MNRIYPLPLFPFLFISFSLIHHSYHTMEYTREEVAKHNTISDFWTIINGKIYHLDETFIRELHPGGMYVLDAAGKDGTDLFENSSHGENAIEALQQFYVGKLKKT
ncbi:cytochrome b5 1 [Angomonas deanei]|uniref:Cytochrome b5-like Heme/Steroid binding domain containing protein, putative n=1 Tax=Angomonas deanei TaxID=59799 RepID=S9WR63_9TRYP|nr:cytochrome b5 1 [Angomonas deanei]EPY40380.1 cytochrome b5 1 [Angomonas deanei]CAD2213038.1 Cytochrome b5-like Heme/Steroid binding domain containing protein, putative [Angomonas deanei]|eukprot:EPY38440.1 cytochrome b5 1 [Angomonas deanei]